MAATTPSQTAYAKQPEMPASTARGAYDFKAAAANEIDPFSDANRSTLPDARSLLSKAEQEFQQKHYQSAGHFYQQAHNLDPNFTPSCNECWAYCKLHGVVEALNQPQRDAGGDPGTGTRSATGRVDGAFEARGERLR